MMRSRYQVEEGRGDRRSIVLTEIPYQVGKNGLVEKIAEAAKDKRIEGVSDIRDESNREGVRIVIDLKRDATPEVVLNQLWRHTPAQSSFPANMLAIRGGRPETLTLRDFIEAFIRFREEVITRRSKFELLKARERAHILLGLVVAVTNLDEVVKLIRGSASPAEAREKLLEREWPGEQIRPYIQLVEAVEPQAKREKYKLSEAQVKAILELRLHRLTALGRDEIGGELEGLAKSIGELLEILANRARLYEVMREEFDEVEAEFATPRMSELAAAADGIEDEDLIEREDMVVTVTMAGYIKRTPLAVFREQKRGGKGRAGMATKDEDAVTDLFVTSTHNPVLFFSNLGRVYRMKVWRLPEGGPEHQGPADGQPAPAWRGRDHLDRASAARGRDRMGRAAHHVRDRQRHRSPQQHGGLHQHPDRRQDRDAVRDWSRRGSGERRRQRRAGRSDRPADRRRAADRGRRRPARHAQRQGDPLQGDRRPRVPVAHLDRRPRRPPACRRPGHLHVDPPPRRHHARRSARPISASPRGRARRKANARSPPERIAELAEKEQFILTVTENGYGKRSSAYEYRRTNRGGQGITNIDTSERNGCVVACFPAHQGEALMLVTDQGKMIRTTVGDIRDDGPQHPGRDDLPGRRQRACRQRRQDR